MKIEKDCGRLNQISYKIFLTNTLKGQWINLAFSRKAFSKILHILLELVLTWRGSFSSQKQSWNEFDEFSELGEAFESETQIFFVFFLNGILQKRKKWEFRELSFFLRLLKIVEKWETTAQLANLPVPDAARLEVLQYYFKIQK